MGTGEVYLAFHSKTEVKTFRLTDIGTGLRKIGGEHRCEAGDSHAFLMEAKTVVVDSTLTGGGIIVWTGSIEIVHDGIPRYHFLVTAETAATACILPFLRSELQHYVSNISCNTIEVALSSTG